MKSAAVPAVNGRIETAFKAASRSTGADFDYLLQTAMRESSLDPRAKAATSSATGIFQFIESTWLEMIKREGDRFGLNEAAAAISRDASGKYTVADAASRQKILALREDPEIAANMAGAYAEQNAAVLRNNIGRAPTSGELYIAHFLGAGGASRLISLATSAPESTAATSFAAQAKANRGIFYNRDGSARTAAEVYDVLVRQHDVTTMIAQTGTKAVDDAAEPPVMVAAYSGFRARDPSAVFDAFFRNDAPANAALNATRYWTAIAAAEAGAKAETADQSADAGRTEPTRLPPARPGAIVRLAAAGDPLDLLQYLKPGSLRQSDLLPPI